MPPSKKRKGVRPKKIPFPWQSSPTNNMAAENNFAAIRPAVIEHARQQHLPTLDSVRRWHRSALSGIATAEPQVAGGLRGEGARGSRLSTYNNQVGGISGAPYQQVRRLVQELFAHLQSETLRILAQTPQSSGERFDQVVVLIAHVHGEWVRIHPFADFNGSTARLLASAVAAYFAIPLDLPGKPRPNRALSVGPKRAFTYSDASTAQMLNQDAAMELYLRALILESA